MESVDPAPEPSYCRRLTPRNLVVPLEEFAGLWHETTRPLTVRAFQILDADGDAVLTRAEYDQLLANIVERLDRNRDGGLSMRGSTKNLGVKRRLASWSASCRLIAWQMNGLRRRQDRFCS